MGLGHRHDHVHEPAAPGGREASRRALRLVLILTLGYLVAELLGAYWANSLALLSDAGHMFNDAAALALAWIAISIASRPATDRKTYGFHRFEVLAALLNGIALIVFALFLVVEAVHRFQVREVVRGEVLLGVSLGGLVVNLVAVWLLSGARHESLNLQGAFLHVVGDLLGSLGAVIAGIFILWKGWYWVDPVASLLISGLVIVNAWRLVAEATHILLEGTPTHIEVRAVEQALREVRGVRGLHDLHIWTITSGRHAVTVHLVVEDLGEGPRILRDVQSLLANRFGLAHSTIQIEDPTFSTKVDFPPLPMVQRGREDAEEGE
jgi:cobalt-zinc-cadmium efflux system protein